MTDTVDTVEALKARNKVLELENTKLLREIEYLKIQIASLLLSEEELELLQKHIEDLESYKAI